MCIVMQGKVPLISTNGLHQLHIFIFFLAIFHVVYGAITMTLGRLKVGSRLYFCFDISICNSKVIEFLWSFITKTLK